MVPIRVLLIEDNEGDIVLTREALEEAGIPCIITSMRDGQKAVSFFENLKAPEETPDLVLLDINLPKISGHEVLACIKRNEKYTTIPVIILTTSSSARDVSKAYGNYANCYITKPLDVQEFIDVIMKIEDFWINFVTASPKE